MVALRIAEYTRLLALRLVLPALFLQLLCGCGRRSEGDALYFYDDSAEFSRISMLPLEAELEAEPEADPLHLLAALSIWQKTRTGQFNVEVSLDECVGAEGVPDRYLLRFVGLDEQMVSELEQEALPRGEESGAGVFEVTISCEVPTAELPKSDGIWLVWKQSRAVGLRVSAVPLVGEGEPRMDSHEKLLALDPVRWRSDTIRLLLTPDGLELNSVPANLPD